MNRSGELPPSDVPSRTPRNIRRRSTSEAGCGIWFLRLFILPHTLVGLGLVGWVFLNLILLILGSNTQAEVVRKYPTRGGKVFNVEYSYGPDGRYRDHSTLSPQEYNRLRLPDADQVERDTATEGGAETRLQVRYVAAGDVHYSHPLEDTTSIWGLLGFSVLFCVFWNGILSVFLYMAWVAPYLGRSLYRRGKVARGRITGKRLVSGKPRRIKLQYEFEAERGQAVKASMTASSASRAQQDAYVGQPVTVLYRPNRPRKSVLYEYGNYEVGSS